MRFLPIVLALCAAAAIAAATAAADQPVVRHVQDVFVDVNPCTGLEHTVTSDATIYELGDGHGRETHTITTSSGFVGRGESSGLFHDATLELNDMLVNAQTGQRIHAQVVLVTNPATGDLEVERVTLTCIPPGRS